MAEAKKYDRILDALQQLMIDKSMSNISVSDIAARAGIGKGSIYYYFPSKEAILDALIKRNYEAPPADCQESGRSDGYSALYADGHAVSGMPKFRRRFHKARQ